MNDNETSFLTDIAKVEQSELEKTDKLRAKCKAHIEEARQHAQADVAAIPAKLQEERRKVVQATREKTALETSETEIAAEAFERQIEAISQSLESGVFQMVMSRILPKSTGGPA